MTILAALRYGIVCTVTMSDQSLTRGVYGWKLLRILEQIRRIQRRSAECPKGHGERTLSSRVRR